MSENIEQKIATPEAGALKADESKTSPECKIEQEIIKTVADTLKRNPSEITPGSKFVEDLAADSLDLVELMMAFEAAFDCDIPDEEAAKMSTVADAVAYVKKHRNV